MRKSVMATVALAGMGLVVTGCSNENTGGTAPTTTAPTASATAAGAVAPCVTGSWRSTGAAGQASGAGASGTISGGGGIAVNISDTGSVTIDFGTMQPVTFTAQVAGATAAGQFTYAGRATGTISTGGTGGGATASPTPADTALPTMTASPSLPADLPTAGATMTPGATDATAGTATDTAATPATAGAAPSAGASSGAWQPVGDINWADTRVTVELTQPVQAKPVDNVRIGDYVTSGGAQTGNVVDVDPFLGEGTYQCQGDTLTLSPADTQGITWTLARG